MRDVSKDYVIIPDCSHDRDAVKSWRVPERIGYVLECKENCGAEDLWIDHDWRDGKAEFRTR